MSATIYCEYIVFMLRAWHLFHIPEKPNISWSTYPTAEIGGPHLAVVSLMDT